MKIEVGDLVMGVKPWNVMYHVGVVLSVSENQKGEPFDKKTSFEISWIFREKEKTYREKRFENGNHFVKTDEAASCIRTISETNSGKIQDSSPIRI